MKYKLNKNVARDGDFDYLMGAGLWISMSDEGTFITNEDGEFLTHEQIKSLHKKGYYPELSQDEWANNLRHWNMKVKPLKHEDVKGLSKNELEYRLTKNMINEGDLRSLVCSMRELKDRIEPAIYGAMLSGCKGIIEQLARERYIYMDVFCSVKEEKDEK